MASRKTIVHSNVFLVLLEKWKQAADSGKMFGALLSDLSNAFDCLYHKLLTAKLYIYCFCLQALKLVQECLSNRN